MLPYLLEYADMLSEVYQADEAAKAAANISNSDLANVDISPWLITAE